MALPAASGSEWRGALRSWDAREVVGCVADGQDLAHVGGHGEGLEEREQLKEARVLCLAKVGLDGDGVERMEQEAFGTVVYYHHSRQWAIEPSQVLGEVLASDAPDVLSVQPVLNEPLRVEPVDDWGRILF